MSDQISVFRSPDGEAQCYAAYVAVLRQRLIPYKDLYIPTRFGDMNVITSGLKDSAPLVLLHPAGGGGVTGIRNVQALSHSREHTL